MTKIDEKEKFEKLNEQEKIEKIEKIDEKEKMEYAEIPIEEKEKEKEKEKSDYEMLKKEHIKLQEKLKNQEDYFNTFKVSPKKEQDKYFSILDNIKEQ